MFSRLAGRPSVVAALLTLGGTAAAYGRARPGRRPTGSAQESGNADSEASASQTRTVEAMRSITIGRSVEELEALVSQPSTLTQMLRPLAEVETSADGGVQLRLRVPREGLAWSIAMRRHEAGSVAWQAQPSEPVRATATFSFASAPKDWGTVVTLHVCLTAPGPVLALLGSDVLEPVRRTLEETALRRLKSLAETGEIPTLERNPSGRVQHAGTGHMS